MELKLAHSPDSDDAFMFYGLATKKIRTGNLKFTHVLEDIESLNQKARESAYDITALSFHAYAHLADRYMLLPCGASFGDRYGPLVVARSFLGPEGLKGKRVAVPGVLTSAYLVLRLYEPEVVPVVAPFDQILERVAAGEVEAGVVIHEGQLTYSQHGLTKVVDLGDWWHQETQLPLPLGCNAIRRQLEPRIRQHAARLLRDSIRYGLEHREEALAYALQFARGLDTPTTDRFVAMYVNERTVDLGEQGRQAIQAFLARGHEKGLVPGPVPIEFVG